jgi:hypothetical protein
MARTRFAGGKKVRYLLEADGCRRVRAGLRAALNYPGFGVKNEDTNNKYKT